MYGDQQFYGNLPEVLSHQDWPKFSNDYAVHAGDVMTAYVSAPGAPGGSPTSWVLAISDSTAGWSDAIEVPLPATPPAQSSAEWIVERGGDPVTEFSPITFTNCTTILAGVLGSISTVASTPIPLVAYPEDTTDTYPTTTLVTPGALNAAGTSFTDIWRSPGFNEWPNIATSSLSSASNGEVGYSQTLTEAGGYAPYTWSIAKGSLPLGLNLNATTGSISGAVAENAVSETFTVLITDAHGGTDTKSLSIAVT
jgi:hypothetical protein